MTFRSKIYISVAIGALALTACGGGSSSSGSSSGGSTTPPTPVADTTAPSISFSPSSLTVESGMTGSSTLSATDAVGVTSGPTVSCTNGGSYSGSTFTAPTVTADVSSVCTATASDAANNSGTATLTVNVTAPIVDPGPPTSSFFLNTSDTVTTDPVLGMYSLPTDPAILIGVTKNTTTNSVSTFAATATGTGVFDDAVVTAQSTLGTVGVAPLDIFFAEINGLDGGIPDLVFLDEFNDELVGVPLNADNTFGSPVTRSVPNGCAAGIGSGTKFIGVGDDSTRDDILVGTSDGLFYVAAGDANGNGGSGLAAPTSIVSGGDFCNLSVVSAGFGRTVYTVYNPTTRVISGLRGEGSDASSYEEEFSADLSELIGANLTPILFESSAGAVGDDTVINVFADPQEGGSVVVITDVGVTPDNDVIRLNMEGPTDLVLLNRSLSKDVILVSPTSTTAVYIRDANRITQSIELIEIGLGFDQVSFAAGAVAFASSTQGNIIVRTLQ